MSILIGVKVKSVAEKYDVPYGRGEANKKVGLFFKTLCVCVLRQDDISLTEQCTRQVKDQLPLK